MNIGNAAGFLINRAVKMANSLGQDSKGSANRAASPHVRAKNEEPRPEVASVPRKSSSAYRVSISNSALQKGAMDRLSA